MKKRFDKSIEYLSALAENPNLHKSEEEQELFEDCGGESPFLIYKR